MARKGKATDLASSGRGKRAIAQEGVYCYDNGSALFNSFIALPVPVMRLVLVKPEQRQAQVQRNQYSREDFHSVTLLLVKYIR